MCGIVGYVGHRTCLPILVEGLKRLEYRGYDSAGVAVQENGSIQVVKAAGKIRELESRLARVHLTGTAGVAHTRWATHGAPNDVNAHPHSDASGAVALVHNGIIENYSVLKNALQAEGYRFRTETDTEVLAVLISKYLKRGLKLEQAVGKALADVEGTYGIAVMCASEPGTLVGARKGSPLVVGVSDGMIGARQRIPVEFEDASEFRYRNPIVDEGTAALVISQSGETADTLAAMREAQRKGARSLGIVNVVGSTIARESGGGVYIHAGPEIGVASTKAFTSQVTVLALLTLTLGRQREMSLEEGMTLARALEQIPSQMETILAASAAVEKIAKQHAQHNNFIYLGRGYNFPVALEGALKLKEISYIHAEGYPAAEMKHGPIALIDENMPIVFICTRDAAYDKVMSNMMEVKARKGRIIAIASDHDEVVQGLADHVIYVPETVACLQPILSVIPLQLLAYHIAVQRGCDVDQPRNLAKSVTVE